MQWNITQQWKWMKKLFQLKYFDKTTLSKKGKCRKIHSDTVYMLKSIQLCSTLCDPMDCSLPGSSVHGILQARTLEWGAVPSPRGSSRPRDWTRISYVSCISWQVPQLNRWIFLNLKVVLWENTLLFDVQTESHPLKASLRYACSDVFLRAWKPKKVFNFLMKKHKPLYQSHS